MKVLIIEDNDYKLDDAIRTINAHEITEYVHVNNYMEAYSLLRKGVIDEFDFIILDIQFFETRPLLDSRAKQGIVGNDGFAPIECQRSHSKFL